MYAFIEAARRTLSGLLLIVAAGAFATAMAVLVPALWLLVILAASAATLMTLACVVATVGVVLGFSAPINLLAWFYAIGLFSLVIALHVVREKLTGIPARIAEHRARRQRSSAMERLSGLRLAAADRGD